MKPFINRFDARFVSRWTERFYRRVAPELAGEWNAKEANASLEMPRIVDHPRVFGKSKAHALPNSHADPIEFGVIEGLGYSDWYREFAGKLAQRHRERQACLGANNAASPPHTV